MRSTTTRFDEMYRDYFKPVHAYCRRRTSAETAGDATAETFLIAWRKIDLAPTDSQALPWLYGIARGVVSNTRRSSFRSRRLITKVATSGLSREEMPDDVIVEQHERSRIVLALQQLRPDDQEVLRLSLWEELSGAELSIALDVSEEAARQRLSRAKKRLADAYNDVESVEQRVVVALEGDSR